MPASCPSFPVQQLFFRCCLTDERQVCQETLLSVSTRVHKNFLCTLGINNSFLSQLYWKRWRRGRKLHAVYVHPNKMSFNLLRARKHFSNKSLVGLIRLGWRCKYWSVGIHETETTHQCISIDISVEAVMFQTPYVTGMGHLSIRHGTAQHVIARTQNETRWVARFWREHFCRTWREDLCHFTHQFVSCSFLSEPWKIRRPLQR